jgi:NADH-quinone oxidoreductase subunit M
MTFLPLAGALLVLCLDEKRQHMLIKGVSLGISLGVLGLAVWMWRAFDSAQTTLQLVERIQWIPTLNVSYFVGVDGLSVTMVMLTAIITPLALTASWGITERVKLYFFLFLILEVGMLGVFTALNFFHWFIYWELGLVPMFFLIRMWGSSNRRYASLKFFLYTLGGSITMLIAFLLIYLATGTFDFVELRQLTADGALASKLGEFVTKLNARTGFQFTAAGMLNVMFWAVFLGFAIKVPIWPFHTWLPDAHTEAPTAGSMVLAAILLKMGVYGFLRIILPIFPAQCIANLNALLFLALGSIVFGAFAAMAQKDAKRMIAYSSVNHMGYCMLGILAVVASGHGVATVATEKAAALNGAILQMFNHGISSAALFFLIGVVYERAHTRMMDDFGGLRRIMPVYAGVWGIAMFSSLGLPGLNGFVSEFLVFKGSWPLLTLWTGLATIGLVATAVFLLTMTQKIFFGPLNETWGALPDMTARELATAIPLLAFMFVIGVLPGPFIDITNAAAMKLIEIFQQVPVHAGM